MRACGTSRYASSTYAAILYPIHFNKTCVIAELTVIIFHGPQFFISVMVHHWRPCQTINGRRYFTRTALEGDICRDNFPEVLSGMMNRKIISDLALYINLYYVVKSNNRRTLLARKQMCETSFLIFARKLGTFHNK
jgi:hypothetical protein